ncbi:hypothetical protein Gohar_002466 [Gossypium harknessii]|uniref:RNase H type-1 domain-containing protein n=1 Tax=Gossypium harknessii TaxID=34285 RepID=A0A7J9HKZ8_9ROSI|nr:hypothetical protein [Gossypium harknessii]
MRLCGKSPGSIKVHKGLSSSFGLPLSRSFSLTWKDFGEVSVIARCARTSITWNLERLIGNAFLGYSHGAYGKNHNLFIFQGTSWSNIDMIKVSYNWARQFMMSARSPTRSPQAPKACSNFLRNWVYLNTDGSVKTADDFGSTEGTMRGQYGN